MKPDPRQSSLGWTTSAPASLPAELKAPRDGRPVRSLNVFARLRWMPWTPKGDPNPAPQPAPIPTYVRLMDRWEPAEAIGFFYENPETETGGQVVVSILATGSRLTIRNREYVRIKT